MFAIQLPNMLALQHRVNIISCAVKLSTKENPVVFTIDFRTIKPMRTLKVLFLKKINGRVSALQKIACAGT